MHQNADAVIDFQNIEGDIPPDTPPPILTVHKMLSSPRYAPV